MKPLALSKSEQFDGIEISWNENYKTHKDFLKGHSGSKEELIEATEALINLARDFSEIVITHFAEYLKDSISESSLVEMFSSITPEIEELYRKSGNLPLPPDDCRDYDQVCQNIFSTVHDFTLYFSEKGLETWPKKNREWLMQNTIKRFYEEMKKLDYEKSKIH